MIFDRGTITILQQDLTDNLIALYGEERIIHSVEFVKQVVDPDDISINIDYTKVKGTYASTNSTLYKTIQGKILLTKSDIVQNTLLDPKGIVKDKVVYIRFHRSGEVLIHDNINNCVLIHNNKLRRYTKGTALTSGLIDPFKVVANDYLVVRYNCKRIDFCPL